MNKDYESCTLCPKNCGADRTEQAGYCGMPDRLYLARAALHMWEEPCISGQRGSGAVFFTGCNLKCRFCQNRQIAIGKSGREVTPDRLAEIFLDLQDQGAANINLVTATHYLPTVIDAIAKVKGKTLSIPLIYNCGGYESVTSLKRLEGLIDVYLPDFKYMEEDLAKAFSNAPDYPKVARAAIEEMQRQSGPCIFDDQGYIQKGTIVRHLILPGHTRNSKKVLEYLYTAYQDQICISLMNQYTPVHEDPVYPELNRRVTKREYRKVLDAALDLGITSGYFQEGPTAAESFIPAFDCTGL